MNKHAAVLTLYALAHCAPALAQTGPEAPLPPRYRIYEPKYLKGQRAEQVARFVQSISNADGVVVRWEAVVRGLVLSSLSGKTNFEADLDKAVALIKRFDVPEPAPPPERQIEMTVNLIRAWTDANRPAGAVSAELAPVVKEMKGALPYAGFALVDTIQSIIHDGLAVQDAMPINWPGGSYFYNLSFNGLQTSGDGKSLTLGTFHFGVKVPVPSSNGVNYQDESITTPLNVREGQKMVLGKIKLHNDDLFVVLSYKLK
jgi:hypothetical protein